MSGREDNSANAAGFKVFIYENEYQKIQEWVSEYPHIETGGDLFGLWRDETTAVVQAVLGPGKNCKRTSTSFFQDLGYLERVGKLLNDEGLCHIGEWHSHHKLGLTKPSSGDERTVWSNMERYDLHHFFLFIATISRVDHKVKCSDNVSVKCFLFDTTNQPRAHRTHQSTDWFNWEVEEGGFDFMKGQSPHRYKLKDKIESGSEEPRNEQKREKNIEDESYKRGHKSMEVDVKSSEPSTPHGGIHSIRGQSPYRCNSKDKIESGSEEPRKEQKREKNIEDESYKRGHKSMEFDVKSSEPSTPHGGIVDPRPKELKHGIKEKSKPKCCSII